MEQIIKESFYPIQISPVENDFITLNKYFSTAYINYIQEKLSIFDIDVSQALLNNFYGEF